MAHQRRGVRFVESLVRRLKHDPSYRIEYDYTLGDLAEIVWLRTQQVVRGFLIRPRFARSNGLVFAGRRVSIKHGRHIRVGSSLILGDEVVLDGLSMEGITIGHNVTIVRGAILMCTGVIARPGVGIRIGDRTGIGDHCFIGGQGGVEIGDDVLFGPGVSVFSENHRFDQAGVLIRRQGEERAPVVIESDCWIGAGSTVLAGVRIGRGSVVGAGTLVTKDVPPESVVVGVPGRVVRSRLERPAARRS
jgi:acetyltransferase-like isoleucine patch superfamily enzyme